MVKTNKKTISIVLAIISLLLIGSGLFSVGQSFNIIGGEVITPTYFSAKCVAKEDGSHLRRVEILNHNDDENLFSCTSSESNTYIPQYQRISCEYEIRDWQALEVYVCDVDYDKQWNLAGKKPDINNIVDDSRCEKVKGKFDLTTSNIFTQTVNAGDYIYIDYDDIFNNAKIFAKYPSYGLDIVTSNNYNYDRTNSCEISSLSRDYRTIDRGDRTFVVPEEPLNIIDGRLKVQDTSRLVSISNVESGDLIYIQRPNYYYKISLTDSGEKYVDIEQGEKYSSQIECVTGTAGCDSNAKLVTIDKTTCDSETGVGLLVGYNPVVGDITKQCTYTCVEGVNVPTNDCREIKTSPCPDERPLWDTKTNSCISLGDIEPPEGKDYSYIILLIVGTIGLIVAGYIRSLRE